MPSVFDIASSVDALHEAAQRCSNSVGWKASVIKWMHNRVRNCTQLSKDLRLGKYSLQNYIIFKINDPKPRTIFATRFRDRVVQRSLLDNGLYEQLTKSFIYDNFACQRGKGLTHAIQRMKWHLQKFWLENQKSNDGYYVQLDIRHYFESTPHQMLKDVVRKKVDDEQALKLVFEVIDSFKDTRPQAAVDADSFGPRGIALGSHLSQLLQLLYLDSFDHFIKEKLRVKHYLRYMDDIMMLAKTKEEAWKIYHAAESELAKLGLTLNPKSKVAKLSNDIKFLKVIYQLTKTGGVRCRTAMKPQRTQQHRMHAIMNKMAASNDSSEKARLYHELEQCYISWAGFAKWRASRGQKKWMEKMLTSNSQSKQLHLCQIAEKLKRENKGKRRSSQSCRRSQQKSM